MNGSKKQIDDILSFLEKGPVNGDTDVVLGVPSVYLDYVNSKKPCGVEVAAQNCYKVPSGAFTGELPTCDRPDFEALNFSGSKLFFINIYILQRD